MRFLSRMRKPRRLEPSGFRFLRVVELGGLLCAAGISPCNQRTHFREVRAALVLHALDGKTG